MHIFKLYLYKEYQKYKSEKICKSFNSQEVGQFCSFLHSFKISSFASLDVVCGFLLQEFVSKSLCRQFYLMPNFKSWCMPTTFCCQKLSTAEPLSHGKKRTFLIKFDVSHSGVMFKQHHVTFETITINVQFMETALKTQDIFKWK